MKKWGLAILFKICILSSVIAQNREQFISFPKGVHPEMATAEVKKLDSTLVHGTIYGLDKTWIYDTLFLYRERTTYYYLKDSLQSIYWNYANKNLDVNEEMKLISECLKQISFFIELYGEPTISILNKIPENYLREWRDIVKATWQTPYGTITVQLRYLTRVFEDYENKQIEEGTYDREFDLEVSYRRK